MWNNKEFLFFRYLILLISTIPLKEISVPLYVCVDFSYGRSYNQMIRNNIEKILDLNIQFQSFPDEKTHLTLSNMPFLWGNGDQSYFVAGAAASSGLGQLYRESRGHPQRIFEKNLRNKFTQPIGT